MSKGNIYYYLNTKDQNPVKDFIESLSKKQRAKIFRIFQIIEEYGLSAAIRHCKKLEDSILWEIRILGSDNIRIIYVVVEKDAILALHGFIKKSQKTPAKEINTALNRYHEWHQR